jgi:hypothetical protein
MAARRSSSTVTRLPIRPTPVIVAPCARRLKVPIAGSIVIGRREHRTRSIPTIRLPTTGKMPRRIVSTSGNSGIE